MDYVLGIDIGTGSVKAVAVDTKCKSFGAFQHHYSFTSPHPGYHEQNPEEIWDAFKKSMDGMIAEIGNMPKAISLSSAMHSLMPVDENGKALAPMITWADNRSAEIAKRLRNSEIGLSIYKATGTPLHAMSPLCKIIWLKENNPDLFSQTHKFISIKEYIWYKLFKEFKIDYSIASCTGLFNITQLSWHKDSLNITGIDPKMLSEPVQTDYTKFLNTGIPVVIGASDGCMANLGSGGIKPGIAVMTIGTSGAVRIASDKPLPNEKAMTFSYILDKDTFICGGPINNGGIALQWWIKNNIKHELGEADYEQLFGEIASIAAGSKGLLFLPYLTGDRAPIWDSESCGVFFGVKLEHEKAHFSRAVLEGICYSMYDVLDAMQENAEAIKQINISGGIVKSETWMQMMADITGKDLVITQTEDASAVGASLLAMKALGLITDYADLSIKEPKMVKTNPKNGDVYLRNFMIFKTLYSALKNTMHEFYKMNL
ncbi:gluconokinase [Pedobacter ginsengisoli]|uniref:Gluconokinase n=1 Tax=Pedobacter ginsengisoli TaxID=363852 RepID=A0A2D1U7H4_9SPHI|nr:gluconokinase [Pedobacter ginsengisoli]ATP57530.1 gluconokinase [Pedobacter ginsengisoli]